MEFAQTMGLVLITAIVAPGTMLLLTSRSRRAEKREDWARQDAVAARVQEVADHVAADRTVVNEKLDVIHSLVNSDMTAALKGQLIALRSQLHLLRTAGDVVDSDEGLITSVQAQIAELEANLAQRAQDAQDAENGTGNG